MNIVEYNRMEQHEKTYWWHVGRLQIIEKELIRQIGDKRPLKILNIGCGTGGTVRMLENFGEVVNVDASDEAIKYMKKNGFKNSIKVEGINLPFETATFDMICAFDVLEHIDKDIEAMQEWRRVVKPGGKIVLTVPAYQWLWSGHDESLHHYRRYTAKHLRGIAQTVDLRPLKLTYAIVFSFVLVVGFRLLTKISGKQTTEESSYIELPSAVNKLFTKLLFVEADLHKFMKLPFGTSVLAVLKK
ncbi:class I SAM-dependent methyltransferase [Candidatus Saccharibacteria bacterium]|nr:class I SAM-dependent methyltransferase [Candidatus Saccharibacteria bacterium]